MGKHVVCTLFLLPALPSVCDLLLSTCTSVVKVPRSIKYFIHWIRSEKGNLLKHLGLHFSNLSFFTAGMQALQYWECSLIDYWYGNRMTWLFLIVLFWFWADFVDSHLSTAITVSPFPQEWRKGSETDNIRFQIPNGVQYLRTVRPSRHSIYITMQGCPTSGMWGIIFLRPFRVRTSLKLL